MKPTITYAEFDQLDLRAGRVIEAAAPNWSQKLLQLRVDFGPEIGERTILTGIRQWYQPESFVNKIYPFVVNLAERKMGEGVSQGMMIMADADDQPTIFELPATIAPGTVIR